jgi:hypothetical protein
VTNRVLELTDPAKYAAKRAAAEEKQAAKQEGHGADSADRASGTRRL